MFLSPEIVIQAYLKGLFPMSNSSDDPYIYWVDPKERGIIILDDFKYSNSLKKFIKKNIYQIKVNENFEKVIKNCSQNKNRKNSWINKQIVENYTKLFKVGKAKSIECFYKGKMVGGLYGIIIGNIFCGESMFSIRINASKVSLVYLAAFLKEGQFKFIDTQFFSDHLKQFGTIRINRDNYLKILKKNKKIKLEFPEKLKKNVLDYFY